MLRDDWYNTHKNDSPGEGPSRKKRMLNWWYYHKWAVLGCVLAAVLVFDFGRSIWIGQHNKPDLKVSYVGSQLPEDTLESLRLALTEISPDLNGDGQVIVAVSQYNLFTEPQEDSGLPSMQDPMVQIADQTHLSADLQLGESFLFLIENPDQFLEIAPVLCRVDGSFPEDDPDSSVPMYYAWKDCPVLAGLDLGSYSDPLVGDVFSGSNQDLLQDLYIGRRSMAIRDDPAYQQGCDALWDLLTAGAGQ